VRLREARHRRGLGDLEADLRAVEPAAMELVDDERQELVIPQALPGEIDGALKELLALIGLGHQPAERVLDHPAIDRRGDAVALGRGDEVVGGDDAPALVLQALSAADRIEATSSLSAVIGTTPMLAPRRNTRSSQVKRKLRTPSRRVSAVRIASSSEQLSSRIPNSSPPRRDRVSRQRTLDFK